MIPVNQPYISKSDAIAVYNAVRSGWVSSSGPQINLFENSLRKLINKKYRKIIHIENSIYLVASDIPTKKIT